MMDRVLVTGATGFVGRYVVRELLSRGITPVCLVRSEDKLRGQHRDVSPGRWDVVVGHLGDRPAIREAASRSQAAIHLVGIIIARRLQGQTFHRIHTRGTQRVVEAVQEAGVKRFVYMSALGTRPDAASRYHRTKWTAEEAVRAGRLDWTILRPSLIHGPEGEFMRLMKRFMCGVLPPVIPCFGGGTAKLQPVSVKDVAYCAVESLRREDTIGCEYALGGPTVYSWIEFYNRCRALMPKSRHWKPIVSQPVAVAKWIARVSAPPMALAELILPGMRLFRFDAGQVAMSQEDSVCDHTIAERVFGIRMRSFEEELTVYADLIR